MSDAQPMELYIVPCQSKFPRYEEDENGNRIEKEPNFPEPPRRWGTPNTRFRVDVPVMASSKAEAREIATDSDYVADPLDIGPFIAEYLGELPSEGEGDET